MTSNDTTVSEATALQGEPSLGWGRGVRVELCFAFIALLCAGWLVALGAVSADTIVPDWMFGAWLAAIDGLMVTMMLAALSRDRATFVVMLPLLAMMPFLTPAVLDTAVAPLTIGERWRRLVQFSYGTPGLIGVHATLLIMVAPGRGLLRRLSITWRFTALLILTTIAGLLTEIDAGGTIPGWFYAEWGIMPEGLIPICMTAALFLTAERLRGKTGRGNIATRPANTERAPSVLPGVLLMLWTLSLLRPVSSEVGAGEVVLAGILLAYANTEISLEVQHYPHRAADAEPATDPAHVQPSPAKEGDAPKGGDRAPRAEA